MIESEQDFFFFSNEFSLASHHHHFHPHYVEPGIFVSAFDGIRNFVRHATCCIIFVVYPFFKVRLCVLHFPSNYERQILRGGKYEFRDKDNINFALNMNFSRFIIELI